MQVSVGIAPAADELPQKGGAAHQGVVHGFDLSECLQDLVGNFMLSPGDLFQQGDDLLRVPGLGPGPQSSAG